MADLYERLDTALMQYSDEEAECVLGVSELDGFLHALACAPQPPPQAQWLAAIWGGEGFVPTWPSAAAEQAFAEDVLALYHSVRSALDNNECAPVFLEQENEDGETYLVVDEWCEGFCLGMRLWGDALDSVTDDMLEPILFFIVDLDNPEDYHALRSSVSEEEVELLQQAIPQCVFDLRVHFGLAKPVAQPGNPGSGQKPSGGQKPAGGKKPDGKGGGKSPQKKRPH